MTRDELMALVVGDHIVRDSALGGIEHGEVVERGAREIYVRWDDDTTGILDSTKDNDRVRRAK